jgi:NUMOD4 motif-containing protein/HNH endonuclease
MEIWKEINGYEGLYSVSNLGRVKSLPNRACHKQEKCLKSVVIKKTGYATVHLSKNGKAKRILVHRLVATEFLDKKEGTCDVNHIDSNRCNNVLSNLEWVTRRENCLHASKNKRLRIGSANNKTKLTNNQVLEIAAMQGSLTSIAKKYNVHFTTVHDIKIGKNWSWLTNIKKVV